jgi:hypothetical protein
MQMPNADRATILTAMLFLDCLSKALALLAVTWAGLGLWRTRSGRRKILMALSILALGLSFVP